MCYIMWIMRRVGIRQLKQNADALVRRVVAGETIEITERGRPVARMVPLPGRSMLDQMMADGRATRPRGNLLSITAKDA